MIKQEYIMLIMNCKKYINKAKLQKTTWLKYIPSYLKFYHVIGEPYLDSDYRFDNENKILWIKVEDDYNSLPKKVIRAYKAVNETFNFKFIFKTDDDQILKNVNFFNILKNLINNGNTNFHYGGYVVDVKQNHLSQYHKIHPELPPNLPVLKTKYCNGRFYFLSRPAIENLISKAVDIEKEYFEDYAIGLYLDPHFKANILPITSSNFFKDIDSHMLKGHEI
jgi:hypothetical protein